LFNLPRATYVNLDEHWIRVIGIMPDMHVILEGELGQFTRPAVELLKLDMLWN